MSIISLLRSHCGYAAVCGGFALSITVSAVAQIVSNPIPDRVEVGTLTIEIEDFATIPFSSSGSTKARINHLKPANDGSGRVFVNDLHGEMYVLDSEGNPSEYFDIRTFFPQAKNSPGLGTGFTSFAFHPEFATNGIFYTAHSENPGSGDPDFVPPVNGSPVLLQGVIVEWTAVDPSSNTYSGTQRELMRVDLVHTVHGMQEISFNTSAKAGDSDYGMLYICIGDAGTTIEGWPGNTHRLDSVLGTILRIDPMGSNSENGQYGIPADNPWASDGDSNTFGEIWAYGFRNPHRISWDNGGDNIMLCGDIGEKQIEELNLIEPGGDYGWNVREGNWRINDEFENNPAAGENDEIFELPADDASFGYTYPVAMFDHDDGFAIVGGYVYRGSVATGLYGKYLCGDIKNGLMLYVEVDEIDQQGQQGTFKEVLIEYNGEIQTFKEVIDDSSRADLRFGYDEIGNLYLTSKRNAKVYKVTGAVDTAMPDPGDPVEDSPDALVNISTRGHVGSGIDRLNGSFVIDGNSTKTVLVRAVGPGLATLGLVDGTLADPMLVLKTAAGVDLVSNDDWEDDDAMAIAAAADKVGAFELLSGSKDASILITLESGSYSAIVSGVGDTEGLAIVEVYAVE